MIFQFCLSIWVDDFAVPRGTHFKKCFLHLMLHLNFSEKPILKVKDHTVSGKVFELRKNPELDLLVTFPRPEIEELPEYYKSEKYISHTDSKKGIFDRAYQVVKSLMLRQKLNWIGSQKSVKGNLLDLGSGTGDFLAAAKKKDWKIHGVEPNAGARKLASEKGVLLQEDSSSFPGEFFDVITMWHVLEHVPNLEAQISELDRLLKRDGLLVIAVPNFNSYDAEVYKEHWAAYDVPRHLYHFSRKSISAIFSNFGYAVIEEKPLLFDSFYVSLLSEKYRSQKSNFWKPFLTGLKSNLKAQRTGEYSSVVYFLKKSG